MWTQHQETKINQNDLYLITSRKWRRWSKRVGDGNVGVKEIEDRDGEWRKKREKERERGKERERRKESREKKKCESKKKRVNVIQEKKMRKKKNCEQHKRQDLCALGILNAMWYFTWKQKPVLI